MAEAPSEVVRARGALDAALLELRSVKDPGVPLLEAERPLARSVAQLYQALASTHDATAFRKAVEEAARAAEEALRPLQRSGSSDPAVLRSAASVADAVRTLSGPVRIPAGLALDLPGPKKGLPVPPALKDAPRLLELQREVLEPAVPLLPPEQPPAVEVDPEELPAGNRPSLEALLAEATAAAAEEEAPAPSPASPATEPAAPIDPAALEHAVLGAALTEEQLLLLRARHFFEDLGTMGLIRRPVADEPWRGRAAVERRLLARVDAVVACGVGVFPRLVRLLSEAPLPDAELTWAAILLHGMVAGDDMADEVVRLVLATDLSDAPTFDAVGEALRFVPNPRVETIARGWLGERDHRLRRLALRALAGRGILEASEALVALDSDDPDLQAEGARALPLAVGALDERRIAALLRSPDPLTVEATLRAALIRRWPLGARAALQWVQEGRGDFARAAVYAALSSTETGRPLFARARASGRSPVLAEALGWLGDLESVDPLLEWLRQGEAAAAIALQRLTGASLTDELPDPPAPLPEDQPFGRSWHPPPSFEILTADPEIWSAWWTKHRARAQTALRWRWGRPFTPDALLWEIDAGPFGPDGRTLSHLELVLRTGESLPLAVDDFVARQEAQVDAWRVAVKRLSTSQPPGSWRVRLGP